MFFVLRWLPLGSRWFAKFHFGDLEKGCFFASLMSLDSPFCHLNESLLASLLSRSFKDSLSRVRLLFFPWFQGFI
jgi:hypothetical protein